MVFGLNGKNGVLVVFYATRDKDIVSENVTTSKQIEIPSSNVQK